MEYKTPAQWAAYFNGNTSETNKILVDVLSALLGSGGAGSSRIDDVLLFEIVSPANLAAVQTLIKATIDEVKARGCAVVEVDYDFEYNNDNQKYYSGGVYFAYPINPSVYFPVPFTLTCNGATLEASQSVYLWNMDNTLAPQYFDGTDWVNLSDPELFEGNSSETYSNVPVDAGDYPAPGDYDFRLVDVNTGEVFYTQTMTVPPTCV